MYFSLVIITVHCMCSALRSNLITQVDQILFPDCYIYEYLASIFVTKRLGFSIRVPLGSRRCKFPVNPCLELRPRTVSSELSSVDELPAR